MAESLAVTTGLRDASERPSEGTSDGKGEGRGEGRGEGKGKGEGERVPTLADEVHARLDALPADALRLLCSRVQGALCRQVPSEDAAAVVAALVANVWEAVACGMCQDVGRGVPYLSNTVDVFLDQVLSLASAGEPVPRPRAMRARMHNHTNTGILMLFIAIFAQDTAADCDHADNADDVGPREDRQMQAPAHEGQVYKAHVVREAQGQAGHEEPGHEEPVQEARAVRWPPPKPYCAVETVLAIDGLYGVGSPHNVVRVLEQVFESNAPLCAALQRGLVRRGRATVQKAFAAAGGNLAARLRPLKRKLPYSGS